MPKITYIHLVQANPICTCLVIAYMVSACQEHRTYTVYTHNSGQPYMYMPCDYIHGFSLPRTPHVHRIYTWFRPILYLRALRLHTWFQPAKNTARTPYIHLVQANPICTCLAIAYMVSACQEHRTYTVYDCMFGGVPAKNTVYKHGSGQPYMYMPCDYIHGFSLPRTPHVHRIYTWFRPILYVRALRLHTWFQPAKNTACALYRNILSYPKGFWPTLRMVYPVHPCK